MHPGFISLSESSSTASTGAMQLQGIVFDMDGTLCEPQNYMFAEMRAALNIEKPTDIFDHIHSLSEPQQPEAFKKVRDIEQRVMKKQVPQPGLVSLMEYLDKHEIKKGICTRNFDAPVKHFLENHLPEHTTLFSPILTRDFKPPKPSPAGIIHIAQTWKVIDDNAVPYVASPERPLPLVMVGDSIDDMIAGRDAGALTVLLASTGHGQDESLQHSKQTDVVIRRLDELIGLLENGLSVSR